VSLIDVTAEPLPKAKAALRSGAGLVTVAVPSSIQATVASFEPSYMTLSFGAEDDHSLRGEDVDDVLQAADKMSAIALGPGLGRAPYTAELVHELLSRIELPMVIDADGLNALAQDLRLVDSPVGARILTPHPGEFQRLSGQRCAGDRVKRAEQAAALARQDTSSQTVVVLKGFQTIIADDQQYAVNTTGNPGMATGGTGDCLTGVIVGLLAQGLSPWEAARLGVYLHGLAGDLAAEKLGQISLIASDLNDYLAEAFGRYCS